MKYITLIALVFISTCCFAMDQKLIDGANKYKVAVEGLEKIERNIRLTHGLREAWANELSGFNNNSFESEGMRKIYQNHINEGNKQIYNLGIQYEKVKEMVKRYEPIKKKYDNQVAIERKQDDLKTAILNITGMLILPLCAFVLWLWFFIYICKRNKRLFKEGKLTQKEYDSMMQNHSTSMFSDDMRTNPATGLRMHGSVDAGGNPAGCPFRDSSMSSASQDYHDRHRWD